MISICNFYQQSGKSYSFRNRKIKMTTSKVQTSIKTPLFHQMFYHSKHLCSHSAQTDCIISRCRHIKRLYFNYKFGWERVRTEKTKNPWKILKPHFSQEFPVRPHPSSPLPNPFPRSHAAWLQSYILDFHLAKIRVNSEVKLMQRERERKRRKGPKNSQSE